jgi:hypothetical protein
MKSEFDSSIYWIPRINRGMTDWIMKWTESGVTSKETETGNPEPINR